MYVVEVEREDDGRWIAEVIDLPGVLAYGLTREEAARRAQKLFRSECSPNDWSTANR